MEIELQKSRNELLHRTNVVVKIRAGKTPTRDELRKKAAAMLGADEKLVVVDKISQHFGEKIATAYLKVYDDVKHLKDIELKYKLKRNGALEEEKKKEKKE
jgi:ribosomal protein S24E